MPRPKRTRRVQVQPASDYFKPRGIPIRSLEEIALATEELEALRLADLVGLDQSDGATQMDVSRPTFARVLHTARAKVADALVNGKALRIEGGEFELTVRHFACTECRHTWTEPFGTGHPSACPGCDSVSFHRSNAHEITDRGHHGRGQKRGKRDENRSE
jgi:uncharacterized protein